MNGHESETLAVLTERTNTMQKVVADLVTSVGMLRDTSRNCLETLKLMQLDSEHLHERHTEQSKQIEETNVRLKKVEDTKTEFIGIKWFIGGVGSVVLILAALVAVLEFLQHK